jgi:hypothetical protein
LIGANRREEKSAWWDYFRLRDLSDDELQDDGSALGGVTRIGEMGRSAIVEQTKVVSEYFVRLKKNNPN